MNLTVLIGYLAIVSVHSHAAGKLPLDVERFVAKREGCDHMRGEIPEPNQKARMREVQREIRRLCTGANKQLSKLKKKYAANSQIMAALMSSSRR